MKFREARRALARTELPMGGTLEELLEAYAQEFGHDDRLVDLSLDALAETVASEE